MLLVRTKLPAELGRHGLGEQQQPKCLSGLRAQRGIFLCPQHARLQVLETAQVGAGVLGVVIVVPFPKLRPQSIAVQEQLLLLIVQLRRGESKDVCFEQTPQKSHDEALEHAQMQAVQRINRDRPQSHAKRR